MKRLVVILVAALSIAVGVDGYARPHHHYRHHPVAAAAKRMRSSRHRARSRARTTAPRPSYSDEIALSPTLLRQLQRNLVDGGYYHGSIDGRLTPATRRALADFQREYHLDSTGRLDRATAEALLGRDTLAATSPGAQLIAPRFLAHPEKTKGPSLSTGALLKKNSGSVLLSHTDDRAVPSALEGLTSEFGMGSGVAPPVLPPETC